MLTAGDRWNLNEALRAVQNMRHYLTRVGHGELTPTLDADLDSIEQRIMLMLSPDMEERHE